MTRVDAASKSRILIADDQADVLKALHLLLRPEGYEIMTASSVQEIVNAVEANDFDIVLMDLNYVRGETSGKDGLDLLERIRQIDESLPLIVMTAWSSIELAVEAMRRGARDFVQKPWRNERLLSVLQTQIDLGRALREGRKLSQEIDYLKDESRKKLIAESPSMRPIVETIAKVGPSDANVLITGENGSGKGVVAQTLHAVSARRDKTLITVNVASVPGSVFESELFGHVAGAFTDARADRMGRFELADKGTLFLDEIAAVPVNLQSKLLRVLESGEFERIGSSRTCHVDVRILSATNADIENEIAAGSFRQDLLYRLNTVHIHVPPLRRRTEDILLLATHFLQEYVTKYRKAINGFSDAAKKALLDYPWPGNVRQLDHTIERAVLMTQASLLGPADLCLSQGESSSPDFENMTLDQIECWAVRGAFDRSGGDVSKAAQALGLSRAALYRRLEKHQIE